MLDKYEKAVMEALLNFLDADDAKRVKGIIIMTSEDEKIRYLLTDFALKYNRTGEDMYLVQEEEEGGITYTRICLRVDKWKKYYMTTVETFAAALRCELE